MTMVAFNLPPSSHKWQPSKFNGNLPYRLSNLSSKLSNLPMEAFNIPSKLFNPFQALQSPFNILQSPQELASCKNTLKVKTLLAKMSEVNEMSNRMREKGVNACLNYLPNPRLPFPSLISLKKPKKKIFLTRAGPREHFLSKERSLPRRSLQNQGVLIFPRERTPEKRSRTGVRSLNAPVRSAILERDREGGGGAPPQRSSKVCLLLLLKTCWAC
jgi:hypothetical protein